MEDIDTSLCTHILYAFIVLDPSTHLLKVHDPWLDIDLGNFVKFTNLKNTNPNAKYMVAIGGWNDSKDKKWSDLLASDSKITAFVSAAVTFLETYGFDGLDLDYEYPGYDGHGRDAPDTDKPGFTSLVKKLRAAFDPKGFTLTAAVSASKTIVDEGYEVAELAKYLDAIHLMSYDLHGSWEPQVDHHAPLYGASGDYLTVDEA